MEPNLVDFFNLDWEPFKQSIISRQNEIAENSYNIVSISTYSGHLENYHSDVWRFLLDKHGAHRKSNLFLSHFIEFLVNQNTIEVNYSNALKHAEVYREEGRIDVLIVNKEQNVCIIIENKINNAIDQENQLSRYVQTAQHNNWEVAAVLYITLTGNTLTTIKNGPVVTPLAAINSSNANSLFEWLMHSKNKIPADNDIHNENIRSFIHQYSMLLKQLESKLLQFMSNEILYNILSSKENFDTANLLVAEFDNIKIHRLKLFINALKSFFHKEDYFSPGFGRQGTYQTPNYLTFSQFTEAGQKYELNIELNKDSTSFTFYCKIGNASKEITSDLLTRIIGAHKFDNSQGPNSNHINYTMKLGIDYPTLPQLDKKVQEFSISIFRDFNIYVENRSLPDII